MSENKEVVHEKAIKFVKYGKLTQHADLSKAQIWESRVIADGIPESRLLLFPGCRFVHEEPGRAGGSFYSYINKPDAKIWFRVNGYYQNLSKEVKECLKVSMGKNRNWMPVPAFRSTTKMVSLIAKEKGLTVRETVHRIISAAYQELFGEEYTE